MKRASFILSLIIALFSSVPIQAAPLWDSTPDQRTSILEAARSEFHIPGLAAAIITADNKTWEGVSGYADLKQQDPVDAATLFSIGSITKTFVATLTLKLIEYGLLTLDDTVGTWLPDLPYPANHTVNPSITIRQLLNHTSGIASYTERLIPWLVLAVDAEHQWTHDEVVRLMGPPKFNPGESWSYSNSNYYLLGMILEKASGKAIVQLLHEELFNLLGLETTFLDAAEPVPFPIAKGYQYVFGRTLLDPLSVHRTGTYSYAWTAGALVSRPADVARFLHELFAGHVIASNSLDTMLDTVPTKMEQTEYGLGIMKYESSSYGTIWMHGGMINGYTAAVWHVPAAQSTIAVTANLSGCNVDAVIERLLDAIY
ncbi:MAG: beta-lactamase family protein [Desulfobacterota bacterium]|nr:beta-lactamase family protein [Thermodesulfobacteriota bacterium]